MYVKFFRKMLYGVSFFILTSCAVSIDVRVQSIELLRIPWTEANALDQPNGITYTTITLGQCDSISQCVVLDGEATVPSLQIYLVGDDKLAEYTSNQLVFFNLYECGPYNYDFSPRGGNSGTRVADKNKHMISFLHMSERHSNGEQLFFTALSSLNGARDIDKFLRNDGPFCARVHSSPTTQLFGPPLEFQSNEVQIELSAFQGQLRSRD